MHYSRICLGCAGLMSLAWATSASAALLVELNAANSSRDPEAWVNVAPAAGGGIGGEYGIEPDGGTANLSGVAPKLISRGAATYYTTSPLDGGEGSWGRTVMGGFGDFPGPTGNEPPLHLSSFSVEIWLRRLGDFLGGAEQHIMALRGGLFHDTFSTDPIDQFFAIFTRSDNGNPDDDEGLLDIVFAGSNDPVITEVIDVLSLPITTDFDQWVFTWNNATKNMGIFRNAVNQTNLTLSAVDFESGALLDNTAFFKAGSENSEARRFNGHISLVRIYDEVIDQSVIDANFALGAHAGLPIIGPPLVPTPLSGVARLTFDTADGHRYRLENTSSLVPEIWPQIPEFTVLGTGDPFTLFDSDGSSSEHYRVRLLVE